MNKAFTLIELLVVVLIIGILSAIALPQYRMAVLKSKYAQLMTLGKTIEQAASAYYLENGTYPSRFDSLGVSIPGTGNGYERVYGDYSCNVYAGVANITDSFRCVYEESDGVLAYHFIYQTNQYRCMVSTTWTLGNKLCQNLTGKNESSGKYGDGNSGKWYLNTYDF